MSRRIAVRRAVGAVVALGLVARVVDLGTRTAHWDEGRVGWWVLHAIETGAWEYRPIIHGPFVQHAARLVVELVGPSDFALRLPVALVSLLLPAAALLYRDHLSDRETVALAAVLAFDPLVLYYSRFFRSDVPLAAFAFVAFGCLLRLRATDRRRWLLAAAGAFALALTTKENALLYPVSWLGAAGVTAAWLRWGRGEWPAAPDGLSVGDARSLTRRWVPACVGALAPAVVILVAFYAPRTAGSGVGLWQSLARPAEWPALVAESTLGSWEKLARTWVHSRSHTYAGFLRHYLTVLATGSGAVAVLAVAGLSVARDRALVVFCGLWGLSAVAGYPYAADIKAPWLVVHAAVPLAVPAAVGAVAVLDDARPVLDAAVPGRERVRAAVFAALLVCSAGQVAVMGVGANYTHPADEQLLLAHGAQPGSQWEPTLDRMDRAAATNPPGEPDVAFYGRLAGPNGSGNDLSGPWFDRLPMSWYVEARGLRVTNAHTAGELADPPPVVVADRRDDLPVALPAYDRVEIAAFRHAHNTTYRFLGFSKRIGGRSFVVYIRADGQATDSGARD